MSAETLFCWYWLPILVGQLALFAAMAMHIRYDLGVLGLRDVPPGLLVQMLIPFAAATAAHWLFSGLWHVYLIYEAPFSLLRGDRWIACGMASFMDAILLYQLADSWARRVFRWDKEFERPDHRRPTPYGPRYNFRW